MKKWKDIKEEALTEEQQQRVEERVKQELGSEEKGMIHFQHGDKSEKYLTINPKHVIGFNVVQYKSIEGGIITIYTTGGKITCSFDLDVDMEIAEDRISSQIYNS